MVLMVRSKLKEKTIAMQPVVLKALAKLVFDFNFSKNYLKIQILFITLLDGISNLDFHTKILFVILKCQNQIEGNNVSHEIISPSEETGNRDIGGFNAGLMRFGSKTQ
jgi:hypothetical protein